MTHFDMSGIHVMKYLDTEDLMKILSELNNLFNCPNMLAIHLSDLGINEDP